MTIDKIILFFFFLLIYSIRIHIPKDLRVSFFFFFIICITLPNFQKKKKYCGCRITALVYFYIITLVNSYLTYILPS